MMFLAKLGLMALAATATPLLRRDVVTVENDITQKIGPQVTNLTDSLNGFPESGSTGAESIETGFNTLIALLNDASDDVKVAGKFGAADSPAVLSQLQNLGSSLQDISTTLEGQEPDWAAIPGGKSKILGDLKSLRTATGDFLNDIIAALPTLYAPAGSAVRTDVDNEFATTIATYEAAN